MNYRQPQYIQVWKLDIFTYKRSHQKNTIAMGKWDFTASMTGELRQEPMKWNDKMSHGLPQQCSNSQKAALLVCALPVYLCCLVPMFVERSVVHWQYTETQLTQMKHKKHHQISSEDILKRMEVQEHEIALVFNTGTTIWKLHGFLVKLLNPDDCAS